MAAKEIQVSDDDGTTWHTLPGSTGEFSPEGEAITDTIFGSTFQSQITGLISWAITSDALFKGFAGYHAKLMRAGTPTTTTGEAMSQEEGQIYQIDDASKQIWDRSATITVYDDATEVGSEDIEWYDYLFGRVKFVDGYTVTGSITIDVSYMTAEVLGKGNTYTLTMSAETIDNSTFDKAQNNGGFRTYEPGLRTVELEIGGIFDASENAKQDLMNRSELIVEIDPVGQGNSVARGFFRIMSTPQSGDVGALEEQTVNLSLNVPDDPELNLPFRWHHTSGTTLSMAAQKILNAYMNETQLMVRYLPEGTTGNSPLDGVEGSAVMSDVSLSGGLSDMNTFNAEMQGSGEWTEV